MPFVIFVVSFKSVPVQIVKCSFSILHSQNRKKEELPFFQVVLPLSLVSLPIFEKEHPKSSFPSENSEIAFNGKWKHTPLFCRSSILPGTCFRFRNNGKSQSYSVGNMKHKAHHLALIGSFLPFFFVVLPLSIILVPGFIELLPKSVFLKRLRPFGFETEWFTHFSSHWKTPLRIYCLLSPSEP